MYINENLIKNNKRKGGRWVVVVERLKAFMNLGYGKYSALRANLGIPPREVQ
jgi:hypothetical protein